LATFKIAAIERNGESVGPRVFLPRASSLKYQFIPSSAAILRRNFKTTKPSAGHGRDGIVQLYDSSLDCTEFVRRKLENRDAAAAKVLLIGEAMIGGNEQIEGVFGQRESVAVL
jgi:hypothetical protein